MPRLAPVTSATGLFCCGKFGFDGLGHVFECESFDERPPVDQDRWSFGDAARHTLLIIRFTQAGETSIAEGIHGLRGVDAVILRKLGKPIVKIPGCDLAQLRQSVVAISEAETRTRLFEESRCNRSLTGPGMLGERKIAILKPHTG